MRTDADIETFVNDLDTAEVGTLATLVANLNPLEVTNDGTPLYQADEINLIQRFQQFATDHPTDEDDAVSTRDEFFEVKTDADGFEAESGNNPDEDGDIPGTGEDPDDVADLVAHDAAVGFPGMTEVPVENGGPSGGTVVHHQI